MKKRATYLVGPMESAKGHGASWRNELAPKLAALDIEVFDPTKFYEKERGGSVSEGRALIEAHRSAEEWSELAECMDEIWSWNERSVQDSNFITAHFSHEDRIGGTIRELQRAFDLKKPSYLITSDPRLLNCHVLHLIVRYGKVFRSFEEYLVFLKG